MADPETGGAGGPRGWRPIDELAALVGVYCWVERRIFELTGGWAAGPAGPEGVAPELRVFWAALQAARCARRPLGRALTGAGRGDAAALVAAPAGPLAGVLEALASEPDPGARADALVGAVLPLLAGVYGAISRTASPVSEGPVMEVLVEARRESAAEIRGGTAILGGASVAGLRRGRGLRAGIEQAFEGTRVFPAVRPS